MVDRRQVYVSNNLVDAYVDQRDVVRLAGESRNGGRTHLFPTPSVIRVGNRVTNINLDVTQWLVDDAIVGVLPVRTGSQIAAQVFADNFVAATTRDVVDTVPGQVRSWCAWWAEQPDHDAELIEQTLAEKLAAGLDQVDEAEASPDEVSTQVEDVDITQNVDLFAPKTPVAEDSIVETTTMAALALPAGVNEAPALTSTITEVAN